MHTTFKQSNQLRLQEICFCLINGCLAYELNKYQKVLAHYYQNDKDNAYKKIIASLLNNCRNLPKEIALKIAKDKYFYSRKVLKYYPNFTEEDLLELIFCSEGRALYKIARRTDLPLKVMEEIIKKTDFSNLSKIISHVSKKDLYLWLSISINIYPNNFELCELLKKLSSSDIQKASQFINPGERERIFQFMGLQNLLYRQFNFTNIWKLNEKNLFTTKEEFDCKAAIYKLHILGKINSVMVLRFLCKGNLYSFIYCITLITDMTFFSVRSVCFSTIENKELQRIYYMLKLEPSLQPAVTLLLKTIALELKQNGLNSDNFSAIIKKSILKQNVKLRSIFYLLDLI